jgi:hypothetical protein
MRRGWLRLSGGLGSEIELTSCSSRRAAQGQATSLAVDGRGAWSPSVTTLSLTLLLVANTEGQYRSGLDCLADLSHANLTESSP